MTKVNGIEMFSDIKEIRTENRFIVDYQLLFFEIILKLIIYFQPFDTKLQTTGPSNLKPSYIILQKDSADRFIQNYQQHSFDSQIGDRVVCQIRKQLYTLFQNFKEWRKAIDQI